VNNASRGKTRGSFKNGKLDGHSDGETESTSDKKINGGGKIWETVTRKRELRVTKAKGPIKWKDRRSLQKTGDPRSKTAQRSRGGSGVRGKKRTSTKRGEKGKGRHAESNDTPDKNRGEQPAVNSRTKECSEETLAPERTRSTMRGDRRVHRKNRPLIPGERKGLSEKRSYPTPAKKPQFTGGHIGQRLQSAPHRITGNATRIGEKEVQERGDNNGKKKRLEGGRCKNSPKREIKGGDPGVNHKSVGKGIVGNGRAA